MELEWSVEDLTKAAKELLAANELVDGYIRPLVFLELGAIGLNPTNARVRTAIITWRWGAYLGEEGVRNGIRVRVSSWRRFPNDSFPNAKATVFPGFFVTVLLSGDVLEGAIVIQERAIGTDLSGKFVLVVGDDNVVEQRRVTPGPTQDDGTIVITEGLDASERYIVEGVLRARPGMPVNPTTATDGGGI